MPGVIPKPNMRRLHIKQVKRQLGEMVLVTTAAVLAFKAIYVDPRNRRYEEFHKTYDCEAALEKMNASGLMQSCPQN